MAKKHGLVIFWVFLVVLTFFVLLIAGSYFYFEMNKLQLYGVNPLSDWKSYVASIIKDVPFVGGNVKYKPFTVIPYQNLLESRLDAFQGILNTQAASLDAIRLQLQSEKANLEAMQSTISASEANLNTRIAQFNAQVRINQTYQAKLQTLDQWITNSNPTQIGKVLATANVPVNVLVDALTNLQPQTASAVLQAISLTNPNLAASIIDTLTKVTK